MKRLIVVWVLSLLLTSAVPVFAHASPQDSNSDAARKLQSMMKDVAAKNRTSRSLQRQHEAEMSAVIDPVVEPILSSVAAIRRGPRTIALGLILSADGKILTKFSNLRGDVNVKINGKIFTEFKVIGIDRLSDLAMLKIDASGLTPAKLTAVAPKVGDLLVSPTTGENYLMGSCGSDPIQGKPKRAMLGVRVKSIKLEDGSGTIQVLDVVANSPANQFGIQRDDIIKAVDGNNVATIHELQITLSNYSYDKPIELLIVRDDEQITKQLPVAELTRQRIVHTFPVSFSHDTKLRQNKTCGGPIINLDGQIVGINMLGIHAGKDLTQDTYSHLQRIPPVAGIPQITAIPQSTSRMEHSNMSVAMPSDYILTRIEALSDGSLAPSKVNQTQLKTTLEELETTRIELDRLEKLKEKAKESGLVLSESDRREFTRQRRNWKRAEKKKEELVRGY